MLPNNPLKKAPFLQILTNEEIDALFLSAKPSVFKKNDVIFKEQTYIKSLPIIIKGVVRVLVVNRENTNKREVLLYYMKAGETCSSSIASGVFNDKIDIRVEAETDCEILFLPLDKFTSLLSKYPELFELLLQNYLGIFKKIVAKVSSLAFYPLDERVLFLLQEKYQLTENPIIETTHEELARELGSTREVITRILQQMEKENIVALKRGKIELILK
ncbi:MAG: Crp/Fnr family transcriptional regulator [Bacteroidia bacterium]